MNWRQTGVSGLLKKPLNDLILGCCPVISSSDSKGHFSTLSLVDFILDVVTARSLSRKYRSGGSIIGGRTFRNPPYFILLRPQTAIVFLLRTETAFMAERESR